MKERQKVATICPYCGVGCGLYLYVDDGRITGVEYLEQHPLTGGALCAKANAVLEFVYHSERVACPLKKKNDGWLEISWEEAFDIVSNKLMETIDGYGPDAVGFIASAKCTNEENYLLAKLARLVGTNNIDNSARLCHAPTLTVLAPVLGSGAVTNPIADLANSQCILIVGSNFAENHPIVSRYIFEAKDKGAKIIVVDPRFTPTAWMADIFLQLKPGTDAALINGMIFTIIKENLLNYDFITSRTEGFDELRQIIGSYTPERVSGITGVTTEAFEEAARIYAKAKASAIIYCMGVTQHTQGSNNVASLANLALICGQIGREGAGLFPLRGQNNVQGACDMGALPNFLPGYISVVSASDRGKLAGQWQVEGLPSRPGLTMVEMINASAEGKLKAMYIIGEEVVISNPNSDHVCKALQQLEFLVVQDIFLTETAKLADVVLPGACWAEKEGTFTNTERRVQWTNLVIRPIRETKADWEIISQIGSKLGFELSYSCVEDILHEINEVIPSYHGITPERIKHDMAGLFWPCPSSEHAGTPILYTNSFNTANGKAKVIPVEFYPSDEFTSQEYPLILTTGRMGLHYNSGSLTRRSRSLIKRARELYVEIHPSDAGKYDIQADSRVSITTKRGEIAAKAVITEKILPGVVFMPFHFSGVNRLTSDAMDSRAKIPEFKVVACKIRETT